MDRTISGNSSRRSDSADAIDWSRWSPVDRATLVFVVENDERILLIRKKRGLGAGKVNGPGGKIESHESPLEGAVREVEEELCVTPTGIRRSGELCFQFADGYSIHVTVFRCDGCEGIPQETAEAIPLWTPIDRIPYDDMWQDDRIWIPLMLAETPFRGRFLFDGDAMLTSEVQCEDRA